MSESSSSEAKAPEPSPPAPTHLRVRDRPIPPRIARSPPTTRPLGPARRPAHPDHRRPARVLLRRGRRAPPLLRPPHRCRGHKNRPARSHARIHPFCRRHPTDAPNCPCRRCQRSNPQRRTNRRAARAVLGNRASSGSSRRPRRNRRCNRQPTRQQPIPDLTAAVKRSIRRGLDLPMSAAIQQDAQTARRLANTLSDR